MTCKNKLCNNTYVICYQHFICQPDNKPPDTGKHHISSGVLIMLINLVRDFVEAHNGPGNKFWKKDNVELVIPKIGERLMNPPIHIHYIRNSLEGIK